MISNGTNYSLIHLMIVSNFHANDLRIKTFIFIDLRIEFGVCVCVCHWVSNNKTTKTEDRPRLDRSIRFQSCVHILTAHNFIAVILLVTTNCSQSIRFLYLFFSIVVCAQEIYGQKRKTAYAQRMFDRMERGKKSVALNYVQTKRRKKKKKMNFGSEETEKSSATAH